jgi:isopenicillin N synthase-like dioxygenase
MQSEVGGLEMDFNGTWEEVPFRPNTFTVNLGNILEHATYGVVKGLFFSILFVHIL